MTGQMARKGVWYGIKAAYNAIFVLLLAGLSAAQANDITVTKDALEPALPGSWTATGLTLPDPDPSLPVANPDVNDPVLAQLASLVARGRANGFAGILYDNRDRGHSALQPGRFPALTHLRYGPELMQEQADYGLAGAILFPAIVLGNSSTALTRGPSARSLPRLAMTHGNGPLHSARLYENNHLYLYPEHRDYDDLDRFPANWPYQVISQGSSGSDRPFLNALAATVAAFPPETLEALREAGLVAPTLQMILRRNLAFVQKPEDYFLGRAHRPVLSGSDLRPGRMIAQANAMSPNAIPPAVRIEVLGETFRPAAGLAGMTEELFTTPSAVARIWRSFAWEHRMVVSAGRSVDPNGRDLSFTWRVLQGDPARVRVEPLDETGTRAVITIQWHDRFALPDPREAGAPQRETARVDIGVFADNGAAPSAPALISVAFPDHEVRTYAMAEGPGSTARIHRINYDALGRKAAFDPFLHWSAPWTDTARYDAEGHLVGWARRYSNNRRPGAFFPIDAEAGTYAFTQNRGRMILSDQAQEDP